MVFRSMALRPYDIRPFQNHTAASSVGMARGTKGWNWLLSQARLAMRQSWALMMPFSSVARLGPVP